MMSLKNDVDTWLYYVNHFNTYLLFDSDVNKKIKIKESFV